MLENVVTPDDLMEEFVSDMVVADDELSDSIFTCVDNFIDTLCMDVMKDETSGILDDDNEGDVPFSYILDKVMEKVDTLDKVQDDAMANASKIDLDPCNHLDPDFISQEEIGDISPEEFQLFIQGSYAENEEDTLEDGYHYRSMENGEFTDANYNA